MTAVHPTQAIQLPALPSLGSIDHYIQAVAKFPLLTLEQEQDMGRRWRTAQDVEAARGLVLSHLRLVVSVARNYLGYGLPHADLIQEGNIGLMKAVRRFDPDRGVRLVSFALHWIKAEIHEYILRNWRLVKVATTKAQRKLFFNLRGLRSGGSGTLGLTEAKSIAKTLGVKAEEVMEMDTRLSGNDIALDGAPDDDASERTMTAPIAFLADPSATPAEQLEQSEYESKRGAGLSRALARLDDRSRKIIEARWLSEGNERTLHDLADEYGVSAERIRQIEARAMKLMREEISAAV
jgi:RNA polymerase sigma-32 factor